MGAAVDRLLRVLPGRLGQTVRMGLYARSHIVPLPPKEADESRWLPRGEIGHAGIDLREAEQLQRLERWKMREYQDLFRRLRENRTINTQRPGKPSLANGWYNSPDAEIYAAMIIDRRPRRVVEVGAGYSTLIARAAIGQAGLATRLTVVDPEPRTDVRAAADECLRVPVERSLLDDADWSEQDVLFIDSSHVCRTRGDLPYLFCRLVPRLPPGVMVHVHDIYLPFEYPNNCDELCYTEQYLLHAALSHSSRYRTLLSSHWLSREHPAAMRDTFGPDVACDVRLYGGCYWFKVVA